MIKNFIPLTIALLFTGCVDDVAFQHQSSLETRSRGVALLDSGSSAQVGMIGNTCQVDVETGMIGSDFDIAVGEDDQVKDSFTRSTLVVGSSGNNIFKLSNDWAGTTTTIYVDNVQDALFTQDGVVAIIQDRDCALSWFDTAGDLVSSSLVPCNPESFTVDRSNGTAYISTGTSLVIASPGDTVTLDGSHDISAFDLDLGILYVAQKNSNTVSALNVDGTILWTTDLDLPIVSLDDMGVAGSVALMTGGDTFGDIIVLDGATGEQKSHFATPGVAEEIKVSQNGQTLAAILDDQIHFYKLISLQ